jgi:hypothetical protein
MNEKHNETRTQLLYRQSALHAARDTMKGFETIEPFKTDLVTIDKELARITNLLEELDEDNDNRNDE